MSAERIDLTDLGLDEVLLDGVDIHIERMDKGGIFVGVTRSGKPDKRLALMLTAHGKTLKVAVLDNDLEI